MHCCGLIGLLPRVHDICRTYHIHSKYGDKVGSSFPEVMSPILSSVLCQQLLPSTSVQYACLRADSCKEPPAAANGVLAMGVRVLCGQSH